MEFIVHSLTCLIAQVYWLQSPAAGYVRVEPMCRLLKNLHQKNSRRPFASDETFIPEIIPASYFSTNVVVTADPRLMHILKDAPHFAPFPFRARLFQAQLEDDYKNQTRDVWANHQRIKIRRGYEVEDGFDALNH